MNATSDPFQRFYKTELKPYNRSELKCIYMLVFVYYVTGESISIKNKIYLETMKE